MILDTLENFYNYRSLNTGFDKVIEFILRKDLKELPVGKYEIEGEKIFTIVDKGVGRKKEDSQLETHEKYIDIQLVLSGVDNMGWKAKAGCKLPSTDYDPKKDLQFFKDLPDIWFPCQNGMFIIFFPEDAHMPMISSDELHKVIVKVLVD